MKPTVSREALTIRRNSSVGRSTARAWYSLFSENVTIQTGNVTKARIRCDRWTPSSASELHIDCHTNARARPRPTDDGVGEDQPLP